MKAVAMHQPETPDAGEGQIYVCRACGRISKSIYSFPDVACAVNSILCYESSLERDSEGKVIKADPVEEAK